VTRTVFIVGAVVWLLVGTGGIGFAALGRGWLLSRLPALTIDADALGGALTAVAAVALAIGVAHVGVLTGLARGWRWGRSIGALLASVLGAALLGTAATAISSVMRDAAYAAPLLGAASVALAGVLGYAVAAVRLARDLGSGSDS